MKVPSYEPTPGALAAYLAANVAAQPVDLWTITLQNGTVLRYTSGDFDALVFAARASTATYLDASGNLQTAAANMPRFLTDAATGVPRLFVEPAATNLCQQSQNLSVSPWSGTASATLTSKLWAASVPFYEVAKTVATTSEARAQGAMGSFAAGTTRTATVALLAGTSNKCSFGLRDGGGAWGANGDGSARIISGPGTLAQYAGGLWNISGLSATVPTLLQTTLTCRTTGTSGAVYFYPGQPSSTTIGDSILATRVQIEAGAAPTSYIPTTATVTRAADAVNTFARGPSIVRSQTSQEVGISVDTLNMDLYADTSVQVAGLGIITGIALGYWDGATVQLDRMFCDAGLNVMGIVPVFFGNVGQVQTERGAAHIEVRSIAELLDIQIPGDLYQPACRNSVFDSSCALDPAANTNTYTIAAGSVNAANNGFNSTVAVGGAAGSTIYQMGLLTITSGANSGVARTVKTTADVPGAATFTVMTPFPSPLLGGETFSVRAGCAKTMTACNAYGNLANFRAEPFVPAPETIT